MPSEWSNRALKRITVHPWTTCFRIPCQKYTSQGPTTHLLSPNREKGARICGDSQASVWKQAAWSPQALLGSLMAWVCTSLCSRKAQEMGDSLYHGYQIPVWGKHQEKTGENDQNDQGTKEIGEWVWKFKKNCWSKGKRNLRVGPATRTKREVQKKLQEDSEVI